MLNIKQINIEEVYPLTLEVPEFAPHYPIEKYYERLSDCPHLILCAELDGEAAGFKIGYETEPGIFYSWVGAVLPDFRRQGLARALANEMEVWLHTRAYHTLGMKTHNKFRNMLLFAIRNDFQITDVEQREHVTENRIFLEKKL